MKKNPNQEIALIQGGNTQALTKAIKDYAFSPKAQCLLLEEGNEAARDLYLELRRPCAQFVAKLFKEHGDNKELIKKSCIGCSLSEENEANFVRTFKDDPATLEEYLKECPEGPMFFDSTFDMVEEENIGIGELLLDLEMKFVSSQEVAKPTFADLLAEK